MRQALIAAVALLLLVGTVFSFQSDEDREISRAQDYTSAILKKTPEAKVAALEEYIRKYPDKSQKFTKLAYYMLAVNHFYADNYEQTIRIGEQAMQLGGMPTKGEEARLYLVVGNAYAVKSTPSYNKQKALKNVNQAITLARGNDNEVLQAARDLKGKLSGPPPKTLTPEQKIKMLVYQDQDYNGAIRYYRTLGNTDKTNRAIHETYATALMKANRLDSALREFQALYNAEKKGSIAKNIAEIYARRAPRNNSYYDRAVTAYIEAALLFRQEGSLSKYNAALKLGEYQLFEKYDFNDKIEAYNAKQKSSQANKARTEAQLKDAKRELRRHLRHLRTTYEYNDLEPPEFEKKKTRDLEKRIQVLESGGSAESAAEGEALMREKTRIEQEFRTKVEEIRRQF